MNTTRIKGDKSTATLRIGTSGFQYKHWKGVFYPEDIPQKRWFEHYAAHFDCVEINNTFYNLPEASTFDDWKQAAPAGFEYVLKYSRYGTHIKRLKDPDQHVDVFMERAERLGDRLGPILVQLPPNWHADAGRLDAFLQSTPAGRRWALEFRDPDWLRDEVFEVLTKHQAALVIHDQIDNHPRVRTAEWIYLRFHGVGDGGNYPHQALSAAARRIADDLAAGIEVYAFFNNDAHGYAVANAMDLRRYCSSRV
jgi:uncharacterized protein YecE (DUF72 family)